MGIFTRGKPAEAIDAPPPQQPDYLASHPGVLTAAGVRIRPMAPEKMRAVAANRQPWQSLAWGYRDMIGELRFALRFRANAISRVRLIVAEINPDDDQPIPTSLRFEVDKDGRPTENSKLVTLPPALCAAAEDELARLPLDSGYSFLGVWSENYDVAGECWMHGCIDPETGHEVWQIRSVDEVDVQGSQLFLRDELGQPRLVDLEEEELHRLWVPHPRRSHLADSGLNALMDVLEDITLIGRELRAVARSRIATNGILLVPEGMTLLRNTREDDDTPPRERFMLDLTSGIIAPISNEGDAGGVAPMILVGSIEDLEAFRHVTIQREDSPTLLDKLTKALGRLANSLDIPPEILTGMAEVNHWTAWQIDSSTFRHHLEPGVRTIVDSLTASFLRAALLKRGFPAQDVARVRAWYDASGITENPNRRQDALDARDRAAISDDAFRAALGFSDSDAPSREEQLLMIAARQGIDQAAATTILAWAANEDGANLPELPAGTTGTPNLAPGQVQRPEIAPAEPGTPETAPSGVAASALTAAVEPPPPYRLNTSVGRQLMETDRALRVQILTAADAAIVRALERAGSRLRSKATRRPAIAAGLKDTPVAEWPLQVGRTQALALGADAAFLLSAAWDELQGKFTRWVAAAVDSMAGRVVAMLGLTGTAAGQRLSEQMVSDMSSRVDPAWSGLEAALNAHAERVMFDVPDGDEAEGEIPETEIPPHLVRTALAVVGGLPEGSGGIDTKGRPVGGEPLGGLGTGTTITNVLDGAGVFTVGYLWVYGVTPLKRQFHPHAELEGTRFASWKDPKLDTGAQYAWLGDHFRPGDHGGCMCDYVPGYAIPDYAQGVREALGKPSQPTQDILNLAASDDHAGRKGTTAQEVRDRWQAIQRLQSRFLNGE